MNAILIYIFLILVVACCLSDLSERIIPNEITIPGAIIGILLNAYLLGGIGFTAASTGWLLGLACILTSGVINSLIWKKPGIGGGDLQLMGMVGAFWGWKVVLATYAIAPFIAAAWAIKTLERKQAYGVFIIGASIISMFLFR